VKVLGSTYSDSGIFSSSLYINLEERCIIDEYATYFFEHTTASYCKIKVDLTAGNRGRISAKPRFLRLDGI
jgi:hypothetical protein